MNLNTDDLLLWLVDHACLVLCFIWPIHSVIVIHILWNAVRYL